MQGEAQQGRVGSFYRDLTARVEAWLASEEARQVPCAELYRHLPGLFLYLAHVALDERVPERERMAILSSLKYIVAPFDLIPEGLLGTAGFRDDLVLAAFVTERLEGRVDALVLREHWEGPGSAAAVARAILDAATPLVGPDLCDRLRRWLP